MSDALHDRAKTLEDIFFAERDRQLLKALKDQAAKEQAAVDLAAATGIQNEALLERLAEMGLNPDTLAALTVVPLLHVAWADEVMDEAERRAVLMEASRSGIKDGTPVYALLQTWLTRKPQQALFDAWRAYHEALSPLLSTTEREALRADMMDKAKNIAHASGGLFGLGSISSDEREALRKLENLLAG